MRAGYKTDIARLAEDVARRDAETVKREIRLLLAVAGMTAAAVAVPGFFLPAG